MLLAKNELTQLLLHSSIRNIAIPDKEMYPDHWAHLSLILKVQNTSYTIARMLRLTIQVAFFF